MKLQWKICFRVCASIFLLFLCMTYWSSFAGFIKLLVSAAMPLLIGCVIAYVVNILMSFYERHYFPKTAKSGVIKSRRTVCMLAAFITLLVIAALLIKLVVPELLASIDLLLSQLPGVIRSFFTWLETSGIITEERLALLSDVDWRSKVEQVITVLATGAGNAVDTAVNLVSSVFSGIVTALFALIFSIYLLTGKEKLAGQFDRILHRYVKDRIYSRVKYVLSVLNECFHKYIIGQCTEAVILGALCTLGMWIFGFPYATMTGAVIAFTALIPVAGGYIGAAVGAFMILTVSPMKALLFLVFIVVLQQLENNLIYPRVVGSSMGLPGIWVLAAVTIGGGVMGILGMLIGVPLAAALYRLLRENVNCVPQKEAAAAEKTQGESPC